MELELEFTVRSRSAGYHTALPDLLARSTPPLHTLSIKNLCLPEAILLRTLALASDLHTLSVVDSDAWVVLPPAALHQSTSPLCPRLSSLVLDRLNVRDGACATMLCARWGEKAHDNGVASLQNVHITVGYGKYERDQAEMDALNAEGMEGEIVVLYS